MGSRRRFKWARGQLRSLFVFPRLDFCSASLGLRCGKLGLTKCDAFGRGAKRRSRVCDYTLERGARGAGAIARRTGGARETLPNLLAPCLQFHQTTRRRARGSRRPHSGLFCVATGAARSGDCSQGERPFALLSARIAKTFPHE